LPLSDFNKNAVFCSFGLAGKALKEKRDCAADISTGRRFKPGPRHFHGLWHCLNTFKLNGFLSEHGRGIYAFEEFTKRQN
jgi:hypothetical protein